MPTQERNHRERDDLTGEHALTDIGQLILLILFTGVWIADSFFLHVTTSLNATVPLAVRIPIGVVLLALAGGLASASHRAIFGVTRETPHVVREGVFAVVRHPMYLSEILLYLGLLLCNLSGMAAAVWLLVIAFLTYVARAEERLLLERFGDEYASYIRTVGMWIPRLRRSG
jgi:protein-S-isoprenylcysteine O-methyltransferase Ste14